MGMGTHTWASRPPGPPRPANLPQPRTAPTVSCRCLFQRGVHLPPKPLDGAADPEGFRDDRITENIPMLISNDPTQYPYRGKFAAQRALDKYGYYSEVVSRWTLRYE